MTWKRAGDEVPTSEVLALGRALEAERLKRDWSEAELVTVSGINQKVWYHTRQAKGQEGNPYCPSDKSVVWMCRALDIDPKPWLRRLGYDPKLEDRLGPNPKARPTPRLVRATDEKEKERRIAELESRVAKLERQAQAARPASTK